MKAFIDDSKMLEEFGLMEKAREHLQELTPTEKIALKALGVTVVQDPKTGENVIV